MVEAVPSTEQLGGFTLRSRTLMLIEITGKYSNPISMVEDVYNTKKTAIKFLTLMGGTQAKRLGLVCQSLG